MVDEMARTKFTRCGVEIRRSLRHCGQESPPPLRKSPRAKQKSVGGSGSEPKKLTRRGGATAAAVVPPTDPTKRTRGGGGSNDSPVKISKNRGKGGGGGSKKRKRAEVAPPTERYAIADSDEDSPDLEFHEDHMPHSSDEDDCPVQEDDDIQTEAEVAKQAEDDEAKEDDDDNGGIEEETCADLSLHFGEDARKDDCELEEDIGDDDAWDDDKIPEPLSSDDENEEEMRPAEVYREDADPEEMLKLGKLFSDADEFKHACLRYTLKTRYNIKYYRSSSMKMGAKCAAVMREDEAPCPWMVYCSFEKRKKKLMVKTCVTDHLCEKSGKSEILKMTAIANLFAERLRLNPKLTAKEIHAEILREYQMDVCENSCIKAKTKVMKARRRTHEEHFDRIWDYQAEVLRTNPGTTFDIETIPGAAIGHKPRFNRLYICFQGQKESWKKTCRPVIGLDGAFLKWDIKGQLLAAVGRDGDNRIVPIAWAIVEIENDTNWDWFVQHLATDLELGDGKDYVIMSDKQKVSPVYCV